MINKLPQTKWANRIILRTEVGSTAHGTGLDGHEDYDEIAVMTQPLEDMVTLQNPKETIIYRPGRGPEDKSQPGDWDLTVHTARKFCRLAAKGNPSILGVLYGPIVQSNDAGRELIANHKWFYSKHARNAYLGYAKQQRERLERKRGGRHVVRQKLEEKYGFDTKYAMHMVRLGFQGIEYCHTGELKLPMNDDRGDLLRSIRKGEIPLDEIIKTSESLEDQLKNITDLPEEPDYKSINQFLLELAKA